MKRMLMVPIHLDALCLKENAYGVAPFVSHELQTYFNAATAQDEHGDRPFLGAALESPPFSDSLQVLGSGVHLHWALPDGLANANHKKGSKPDGSEDDIEFLPVPNRWLVVRSEKDGDIWKHTSKFWVIESDFVSETSETTGNGLQSVSYPTPLSTTNATPFRFLGRKNETDSEWKEETDPKNYLPSLGPRLTVTGWGDPSFAAFYPGCYGVFGLYDETPAKANTRYDVFGWYGTPSDDPFLKFAARFDGMQDQELRHFLNMHVREPNAQVAGQIPQRTDYLPEKSDSTPPLSGLDLSDAFLLYMQEQFGWTVEGVDATHPLQTKLSAGAQFDGTLCYSRITLNVDTQNQHLPVRQFSGSPVVAVGNTGAEALASRLGDLMVPGVTAPDGQRSQDRQNIEELLLAMDLAPMLSGQDLDLGAKFKQARHARGFRAVTSGAAWSIRPAVDPNASASAPASAKQQTDMPTELATQLDELNRAQSALDQINGQINTLRQQLFNDWNRYLGACYPGFEEFSLDSVNSDRVARIKDYMINDPKNGAAAIDSKIRERGVAQFVRHDNGQWELKGGDEQFETADGRLVPSIANRLKTALTATSNSLAQFNAVRRAANLGEFVLQQGPGARFYEPNEPVVLLSGDPIATPSPKHGRDAVSEPGGNLRCQLVELSNFTPGGANFPLAEELIRKVASVTGQEGRVGFKVGSENPWNPLLMEWEALVATEQPGHDFSDYLSGMIQDDPQSVRQLLTLDVIPASRSVLKGFRPISGRTVLSSHSRDLLQEKIESYLLDFAFQRARLTNKDLKVQDVTAADIEAAVLASDGSDPVRSLHSALGILKKDPACLTQSLGGFNQSLLMQRPGWQVSIADPLAAVDPIGFDNFRAFAQVVALQFTDPEPEIQGENALLTSVFRAQALVRRLVASFERTRGMYTPAPSYPFYPIRHGQIVLTRLRVIDTFGQVIYWATDKLALSASLYGGQPDRVALTPRITQAARLNFRWVSAGDDSIETNDHPGTTPICGWFLANHLDESMLVYDGAGTLLGAIDQAATWRPAPGREIGPVRPQDIENPNLAKLVLWFIGQGAQNFQDFLGADKLERALENILPDSFAQHKARALLVGRPLALVRTRLNLELRDTPAISQSDLDLESRLNGGNANERAFTKVQFPIVIGDHNQFNDGVVAYWVESREDASLGHIAMPAADSEKNILFQSLADPPTMVSMLVDPRASVTSFCGVVPAKEITIPSEQFAGVLKGLEVNFFTAPVLTEPGMTEVPISQDPGYNWTWIQRDGADWTRIPEAAVLSKEAIRKAFPEKAETIWNRLAASGWVTSSDPESAIVVAQTGDKLLPLGLAALDDIAPDIKRVIDSAARSISPVRTHAHFGPRAEIREGWLQLTEAFED